MKTKNGAKLTNAELEQVAGGSIYEEMELFRAFRGNNAFQKDYPGLFAPPVNNEVNVDDKIMAKALLEKLGIKAKMNDGIDYIFSCNIYESVDTGGRLYHEDVIKAVQNYKG